MIGVFRQRRVHNLSKNVALDLQVRETRAASSKLGIDLLMFELDGAQELEKTFRQQGASAMMALSDPMARRKSFRRLQETNANFVVQFGQWPRRPRDKRVHALTSGKGVGILFLRQFPTSRPSRAPFRYHPVRCSPRSSHPRCGCGGRRGRRGPGHASLPPRSGPGRRCRGES